MLMVVGRVLLSAQQRDSDLLEFSCYTYTFNIMCMLKLHLSHCLPLGAENIENMLKDTASHITG